ncbi:MAG TPA: helix-turn-helix transcriptional regulator [Propionicimonas sp.]|nr:helix-turn-helix transcriptional regulator [Propionicimonas sp.]HRA05320.1 helix-turn-helix transcriptional regulator [Propionicimonas sp.]
MTPVDSQKAFADKMDAARVAQHLSIRTMGRIAGVPPTTVHGWLNGTHFPSMVLHANYLKVVETLGLVDQMPDEVREALWIADQSRLWAG